MCQQSSEPQAERSQGCMSLADADAAPACTHHRVAATTRAVDYDSHPAVVVLLCQLLLSSNSEAVGPEVTRGV
jgi:hypothetical protein